MAAMVWLQVIKESVVREGDPASNDPDLHLDLGIRGSGILNYAFKTAYFALCSKIKSIMLKLFTSVI